MNDYETFIAYSRYSRWLPEEKRRETWPEVVERYIDFMSRTLDDPRLFYMLREAITNLEVMPSMRCLMTAGPALERTHVAGYNCAYLGVDDPVAFDEAMYILMCGTGVGFSVERKYTEKLPVVKAFGETGGILDWVADSKEGWATALRYHLQRLWGGVQTRWDFSRVRPAGSRLVTFGGRASGPEPLNQLFDFCTGVFKAAQGRKLTSLECHDIMCKIAEVVVVGGVRRSALISLSDFEDTKMRDAKTGEWWVENGQRGLANNSAVYMGRPDVGQFLREWQSLYDSKSGERGIFNREAALHQVGRTGRRSTDYEFGCNPCAEILLRPNSFC